MSITLTIPKFEPVINYEVNIKLDEGTAFHFILGHNGTGKTILAKSILGLNHNLFSSLLVNDENPININDPALRRYLPQCVEDALFPQFSIADNIFQLNKSFNIKPPVSPEDIKILLEVENLNVPLFKLSTGQKKKLLLKFIIQSLPSKDKLKYPMIVILDEPFSGIDKDYSIILKEILNQQGEKYKNTSVFFLIIEHETILNIPTECQTDTHTIRKGVEMKIVKVDKLELK